MLCFFNPVILSVFFSCGTPFFFLSNKISFGDPIYKTDESRAILVAVGNAEYWQLLREL